MSALAVEGLGVCEGGRWVVRDVWLRVEAGESLCLIGESGGGKSLIAAVVAGVLPGGMRAEGRIVVGGRGVAAADQLGVRALWDGQVGLLPQEPGGALAPLLGGVGQIRLGPPRERRAEAVAWLARFGLDGRAARRMPHALSGGMAQRLLAALALRTGSRVLVADEPTKGLDPARRAEVVGMLGQLRDGGRALLVVTHDLAVVRGLGGQMAVLEGGRVVEVGAVEAVLRAPRSAFGRACLAGLPARVGGAVVGEVVVGAEGLVAGRRGRGLGGALEVGFAAGTVTGVSGASGVGKTTLGDTLLGLVRPVAGEVRWLGRRLDGRTRRALRPRFQKLHQDPGGVFPAGRRYGESLGELGRLRDGAAMLGRVPGLMERLRVPGRLLERMPGTVSGGEAQRLALVRVLAARPAFLVADEPCSRLDPPVQAEALALLRGVADEDAVAVMLITHDAGAIAAVADGELRLG